MNTPLWDFVRNYADSNAIRLHMPGHKGSNGLGIEAYDITEISGADVLYAEDGILNQSQENASLLFQTKKTLYSTEGSTLAIRAMLFLALRYAKANGLPPLIAAGRNAHRSFLTSCALLDIDPLWISPSGGGAPLSLRLTPADLAYWLSQQERRPVALYLTSPDYLGNLSDLKEIADLCHQNKMLLLVDNAHGSYLQFLSESIHPISLGADLCCDSAHKTLPALTGAAYLHIGKNAPSLFSEEAKEALAMFASTSPSYLILASLDRLNRLLSDEYTKQLTSFCQSVHICKKGLAKAGFLLIGNEPMKITLATKSYGYKGIELADRLRTMGIEAEFADPDYLVLMPTPANGEASLQRLYECITSLPSRTPLLEFPPKFVPGAKELTPREAIFSPWETIPASQAAGRILASPCVTCPPAVPIALCGERMNEHTVALFDYYNIKSIRVVK